jgi:single-strand DNA-binding protein
MLNKAQIIGFVGKEPEQRSTSGGTSVCNFSVATTRRWTTAQGEKQEKTTWHNCVAWKKLAEVISQYVHRGTLVYVEGEIENTTYEDRDGNKKYKSEIRVVEIKFLGGKREGGNQENNDDRAEDGRW